MRKTHPVIRIYSAYDNLTMPHVIECPDQLGQICAAACGVRLLCTYAEYFHHVYVTIMRRKNIEIITNDNNLYDAYMQNREGCQIYQYD